MSVVTLDKKQLGAFYTPPAIAEWLAAEILATLGESASVVALDPACGDGQLLEAVRRAAGERRVTLMGVDIDSRAIEDARRRLGSDLVAFQADALVTDIVGATAHQPNVLIANPPWGAVLPQSRAEYRRAGFSVAHGQFDSFDLFVELAIRSLSDGGVLGVVLPDALLLPEHERTRRLLLTETELVTLVRLGEGVFEGVFRGSLLLVARRARPRPEAMVRCARLHFGARDDLIRGATTLAELLTFHVVPHGRFLENLHAELDLDVRATEQPFYEMRRRSDFDWAGLVTWGRGIEIGKNGEVRRCGRCGFSRPSPKADGSRCACGAEHAAGRLERIIRHRTGTSDSGWAPLIVGSDVQRYRVRATREVLLAVPGVTYKAVEPGKRRLLVRKTGVSIQASVDDSDAHTVQSVFHCVAREGAADTIDFLLGILSSRPMQAYYLRVTGEHEWRSHPYVTPRVIRSLPVPDPTADRKTARRIARLAREMTARPSTRADLRIDEAVADLYGIGRVGIEWCHEVLADAQQLQPIARLALPRQLTLA